MLSHHRSDSVFFEVPGPDAHWRDQSTLGLSLSPMSPGTVIEILEPIEIVLDGRALHESVSRYSMRYSVDHAGLAHHRCT